MEWHADVRKWLLGVLTQPFYARMVVRYLTAQLAAGHDNAAELYREIVAQGFKGSASRLRQRVNFSHNQYPFQSISTV